MPGPKAKAAFARGNGVTNEIPMSMTDFSPARASILVVEDSLELQNYLRFVLELDRYQVEIAGTGEEALRCLRRGCSPRVVLLDLQMPGMDGLETLRILRGLHPSARVIMCSGVEDPEKIQEALRLGAEAYLIKPVRHLYLSAAIERCLGESSGESHSTAPDPVPLRPQMVYRPN